MDNQFPFSLLPKPVWEFVGLCSETTEAPDEFLAAGGLFVTSILAGRWVEFNGQTLNDYFLLVGDTGIAKKTTAQTLAIKLLRDVLKEKPNLRYSELEPIGKDREMRLEGPISAYPIITHFSIEGLQTHAIGSGTSTGITMGEYGSLFKIDGRQGQQNTVTELTNMYDGNPIAVTTVQRNLEASNYTLSVIAGSTKSWLCDFTSSKNIGGGFVNRHLTFTGFPERIIPTRSQTSQERWRHLVDSFAVLIPTDLRPLKEGNRVTWVAARKELNWTPNAEALWKKYYRHRIEDYRSLRTESLSELSARELTHATKMAGVRSFAEKRNEVTVDDIVFGVEIARWATRNTIDLVKPHKYFNNKLSQRILKKIEMFKPISKTELAKRLGGKQEQINDELEHLITDKYVMRLDNETLVPGPSTLNYRNSETEKYFGKTNISEFYEKLKVEDNNKGISNA